MNKSELLQRMDEGYAALLEAIGQLDAGQMLAPAADGWSAKDQLAHVAAWERGFTMLLTGRSQPGANLGIDKAVFAQPSFADINNAIWQAVHALSLGTVMAESQAAHTQLRSVVDGLTDAELARPFREFNPAAPPLAADRAILGWIAGSTYEHYEEHIPLLLTAAHVDDH